MAHFLILTQCDIRVVLRFAKLTFKQGKEVTDSSKQSAVSTGLHLNAFISNNKGLQLHSIADFHYDFKVFYNKNA